MTGTLAGQDGRGGHGTTSNTIHRLPVRGDTKGAARFPLFGFVPGSNPGASSRAEARKRPRNSSILGRVPQSKLQRSQGFGQRPLRANITMPGDDRPWLPVYPRACRFSDEDRKGFPLLVHRPAEVGRLPANRGSRKGRSRRAGRTKTPEGTNQSAVPWPRMQAPATRVSSDPDPSSSPLMQASATPLMGRSGPFRQDLPYGRGLASGYGVIHELWPGLGHLPSVVHGPSTELGDEGVVKGGAVSGQRGRIGGRAERGQGFRRRAEGVRSRAAGSRIGSPIGVEPDDLPPPRWHSHSGPRNRRPARRPSPHCRAKAEA